MQMLNTSFDKYDDNLDDDQTSNSNVQLYEIPTSIVILLSIMYLGVSLCAVFGNMMVFYIVLISKRMRNVTNLFIANLALADILIGSLAVPFQFQAALLQRWLLPTLLCSICPTVQVISLNVSIFTLTAIAVDRHKAITQPLANKLTKFKANIIIVLVWCFSLLLAIPTFLSWEIRYIQTSTVVDNSFNLINQPINDIENIKLLNINESYLNQKNYFTPYLLNDQKLMNNLKIEDNYLNSNLQTYSPKEKFKNEKIIINRTEPFCDVSSILISDQLRKIYHHILVSVQFFIPLFVISFAYIHMAIKLNSEDLSTNARNDCQRALQVKRRIIKMLFIVVALFAICWAPYQMYNALQEIYPSINEYRYINIIWFMCHWLAMSNSCYNPFIYAIYSERFKSEFQSRFSTICFWTKWFSNTNHTDTNQDYNALNIKFPKTNLSVNRLSSVRSQIQLYETTTDQNSKKFETKNNSLNDSTCENFKRKLSTNELNENENINKKNSIVTKNSLIDYDQKMKKKDINNISNSTLSIKVKDKNQLNEEKTFLKCNINNSESDLSELSSFNDFPINKQANKTKKQNISIDKIELPELEKLIENELKSIKNKKLKI